MICSNIYRTKCAHKKSKKAMPKPINPKMYLKCNSNVYQKHLKYIF